MSRRGHLAREAILIMAASAAVSTLFVTTPTAPAAVSISPLSSFGGGDGWLAPGEGGYNYLGVVNNERGLAFGNDHLYLVSRFNGTSNVRILDATSGADLGGLDVTGITGGTFAVNAAAVGGDGAIYVGNLTANRSTSPFKVYKWTNEVAAPTVAFTGATISGARVGDTLAGIGSGSSTRLAAGFGSTPAVAGNNGYTIINPTAGTSANVAFPGTPPNAGDFRLGITFTDATHVLGTQSSTARYTSFAGTSGTLISSPAIGADDRLVSYATVGGQALLATQSRIDAHVSIYNATNPDSLVLLGTANNTSGTLTANSNGSGQLAWDVNGNTATLYALSTNQGIQAFTVNVPPPARTIGWYGQTNSTWDGSTQNWKDLANQAPTTYQDGDNVEFLDSITGANPGTITLNSTVAPGSLTFRGQAFSPYTITGPGSITGTTGIRQVGAGVLNIETNNTFTGPIIADSGEVTLSGSNTPSAITMGGGELNITGNVTTTNTTVDGYFFVSGQTPAPGVVRIGYNGSATGSLTGNVSLGQTTGYGLLAFYRSGDLTFAGAISSGSGASTQVHHYGPGTTTLSGASTYICPTFILGGTLKVTNNNSLGSITNSLASVRLTNGTLDIGGVTGTNALDFGPGKFFFLDGHGVGGNGVIINSNVAAGQQNAFERWILLSNSTIGGPGRFDVRGSSSQIDLAGFTLTKKGSGQFSVVGSLLTNGNVNVTEGTFSIEGAAAVAGTGTITYGAGTTAAFYQPTGTISRPMIMNGTTVYNFNQANAATITSPLTFGATNTFNIGASSGFTFSGGITETAPSGLTKTGNGTLVLTGAGSYTGGTTVNAGVLAFANGALGTGPLVLSGTSTLRWLAGENSARAASINAGATASYDTNGNTVTLSGAITGGGALRKLGAGTLSLSGANSYAGGTQLAAGNLHAAKNTGAAAAPVEPTAAGAGAADTPLGSGPITYSGGSLQLADGVTLANDFANSASTADNMIDVPAIGAAATFAGNVAISGSGQFRPAATGSGARLALTGTITSPAAIFVVPRGNVEMAGTSSINTSAAALLGRANQPASLMSFTVRNDASAAFGSLSLGGGASGGGTTNLTSLALTVADNAALTVAGNIDLANVADAPLGTSVDLDGGVTTAGGFTKTTAAVATKLRFNGGTLRAAASNPLFLPAESNLAAEVHTGGAVIDTNGFDVTIAAPLEAAGASTGGLTKNGAGTLVLTAPPSYAGATTVNGGTLELATSLTTSASISVNEGGKLKLAPLGKRVLAAPTIAQTGATSSIDLADNKLVTSMPAGSTAATPGAYDGVQGMVQKAYNFSAWDGLGNALTTSMPDAGPATGLTTIGVATGEQILFLGQTETGLFAGQTVTGATTIAMYTYAGDMNFDGLVDGADYGVIDNYVQFPGTDGYVNGDLNYDGVIDGADYGIIDNTIQLQGDPIPTDGSLAGPGPTAVAAVPEPTSLSVLGLTAAASLLGPRWRRGRCAP